MYKINKKNYLLNLMYKIMMIYRLINYKYKMILNLNMIMLLIQIKKFNNQNKKNKK